MKHNMLLGLALSLMTAVAPTLSYAADTNIPTNNVKIGQKSTANKSLTFDLNAGAANPKLRATTSGLQFSNDGVNFLGIGAGGSSGGYNLLQNANPDFEQGLTGYTASSTPTLTLATSGTNLLLGNGSGVFTPTAAGQYVDTSLLAAPNGVSGQCEFDILYRGGQDALYTLQVYDGSANLIAQRLIDVASSGSRLFGLPFVCASGTSYKGRLITSGVPAAIALDTMYLGSAKLAGFLDAVPTSVQKFTTSGTYTKPASVRYIKIRAWGAGAGGGGGTSGGAANVGYGPSGPTLVGSILSVPSAVTPSGSHFNPQAGGGTPTYTAGIVLPIVLQPGSTGGGGVATPGFGGATPFIGGAGANGYQGVAQGTAATANSGSGGGGGGGNSGANAGGGGGSGSYAEVIIPVPASSYAITIPTGGAGGLGNGAGGIGGAGADGAVYIEEYGYASGQAFTPATVGWRVDANISGANNTSLGTSASVPYIEATDSALSLTANSGSLPVGIACASGTSSVVGNPTCTGSRSIGLTFNLPVAGAALACASFSHLTSLGGTAGASVESTFQIGETTAASSTLVTGGNSRVQSRNNYEGGSNSSVKIAPLRLCGTFNWATAGQKTLRLMYTQAVAPTVGLNVITTDAGSTVGGRDVHWEVYPINQNYPAPVIVGPFSSMPTGAITSAAYTTLPSDSIIDVDSTSNAVAITLVSPVGLRGKSITIARKNAGTNSVSITGLIKGTTKTVLLHAANEFNEFYSDGTSWQWRSPDTRSEVAAFTCTTGTSTLSSQSGNWLSSLSAFNGNGTCTAAIPSGIFSSLRHCAVNWLASETNTNIMSIVTTFSETSVSMNCHAGASACSAVSGTVSCLGYR